MIKFLTFVAFFLLGIWFLGLILRATFSRFLRKHTEAYQRAAKEAQRQARAKGKREGEVTVERTRASVEKKVRGGVGEYVEFEEVTITEDNKGGAK